MKGTHLLLAEIGAGFLFAGLLHAAPTERKPSDAVTGSMVLVKGANFEMGSNDGDKDERPLHRVHINNFEMDRTEVTVAAYRECIKAGGCIDISKIVGGYCNIKLQGRDNHPMNCVNWEEARQFCQWANKRLPTEAEWEYAARGAEGRKYPWGGDEPSTQLCWKHGSLFGYEKTCAVGSHPNGSTPTGIQDMAGNVAEWTSAVYCDSYDKNCKIPKYTSAEGTVEKYYASRGGDADADNPLSVRTTNRYKIVSGARSESEGFRCARTFN